MKRVLIAAVSLLLVASTARAQEDDTNMTLALRLVDSMNFCEMMERNLEEIKAAQLKQMADIGSMTGKDLVGDISRTYDMIREVMDCESMKTETAAIYAELFTGEELDGLIKFYRSDIGKSFNRQQPEIMRRSMEISMKRIQKIMPQIMQKVMQEKNAVKPVPAAPAE